MQQGSGAISSLSQPSPLKNFVLGVTSSSAAIHWSCLYGIRRVRKLISNFPFNSQWVFPSLFYLSLPLLFYWLLHISSFLFTSFLFFSSFLYCFLLKNFFPFLPVRMITAFRVSTIVRRGLHDRRRLRYECTWDFRETKPSSRVLREAEERCAAHRKAGL